MNRYCFALDLKDDPQLIAEYEKYHQRIWPEIAKSLLSAGIRELQIYRIMNRLFMILDTDDEFSFEKKLQQDQLDLKVQEWETLMWKYQQALPGSKAGEKWRMMDKIFDLKLNG
jgi:L-rhamnose mutarotase